MRRVRKEHINRTRIDRVGLDLERDSLWLEMRPRTKGLLMCFTFRVEAAAFLRSYFFQSILTVKFEQDHHKCSKHLERDPVKSQRFGPTFVHVEASYPHAQRFQPFFAMALLPTKTTSCHPKHTEEHSHTCFFHERPCEQWVTYVHRSLWDVHPTSARE